MVMERGDKKDLTTYQRYLIILIKLNYQYKEEKGNGKEKEGQ